MSGIVPVGRDSLVARLADRRTISPALAPALIWAGVLFGGLDSGLGAGLICLAATALLVWQLWLGLPEPDVLTTTALPFALLATALAWGWCASVSAASLVPDLATHGAIGVIGSILLLLLGVVTGVRRASIATLLDWILVFGLLDLVVALGIYTARETPLFDIWEPQRSERLLGTVNNANAAGALCGLIATLALARLLSRRPLTLGEWRVGVRLTTAIAGAALALAIAALLLTASRSGFVLTCLALAAVAAMNYRGRRRIGIVMGALALGMAVALTSALALRLLDRFEQIGEGSLDRVTMWTTYADLAARSPWFGYGFGSFPTMNARYVADANLAAQLWMVNSPHNLALHLLLEGGWPYALLIAAAGAVIVRAIMVAGRLGAEERATLLALAILLGSSSVDLALEMPAIAALALFLFGSVWGSAIRPAPRLRRSMNGT